MVQNCLFCEQFAASSVDEMDKWIAVLNEESLKSPSMIYILSYANHLSVLNINTNNSNAAAILGTIPSVFDDWKCLSFIAHYLFCLICPIDIFVLGAAAYIFWHF